MADRALQNPKIKPIWNTAITEYKTDAAGEMGAVTLKNLETGEISSLGVKCVFIAIGHTPNTTPFRDKLEMDANGYLIHQHGSRTNIPGVFAAGDVVDPHYRQAITAAGQGCMAAMDAERYLTGQEGD
jgi:thioredoxin reductase (NADPH)